MNDVLRGLLPAVLLAALVAVAPPAGATRPADACRELDLDDEAAVVERADRVDDVFVGRVDDVVRRRGAGAGPRERVIAHRVTVTTVLSGELRLGEKVTVLFEESDAGRNRLLGQRETHLFFTRQMGGETRADYCDGSKELPGGLSASLQRQLEGYLSGAPEPRVRVELHRPDGGADEPPRLRRVVAPGAALSLIGVLGLFLQHLSLHRLGDRPGQGAQPAPALTGATLLRGASSANADPVGMGLLGRLVEEVRGGHRQSSRQVLKAGVAAVAAQQHLTAAAARDPPHGQRRARIVVYRARGLKDVLPVVAAQRAEVRSLEGFDDAAKRGARTASDIARE